MHDVRQLAEKWGREEPTMVGASTEDAFGIDPFAMDGISAELDMVYPEMDSAQEIVRH